MDFENLTLAFSRLRWKAKVGIVKIAVCAPPEDGPAGPSERNSRSPTCRCRTRASLSLSPLHLQLCQHQSLPTMAQQMHIAETIRSMKLAMKRRADDSDSDVDMPSHTNRGNKLKRKAKHVQQDRLDDTGRVSYRKACLLTLMLR